MNNLIEEAIQEKRILRFYYDGGIRIVEPYCYGVSKASHDVLRAYQIAGHSKSGKPIGWRLFKLSEIHNLGLADERFEIIRSEYNPNDSGMIRIYCRI